LMREGYQRAIFFFLLYCIFRLALHPSCESIPATEAAEAVGYER
jgi:hypothetical protein